jgi:hypothetical protein
MEDQGKERPLDEIGPDEEQRSQLGEEREGALEPREDEVRPESPED